LLRIENTIAAHNTLKALNNDKLTIAERTELIVQFEKRIMALQSHSTNYSHNGSYQKVRVFNGNKVITASSYGKAAVVYITEDRKIFQISGTIDNRSLQNLSKPYANQTSFDRRFGSGHSLNGDG
jgi:hypothetical protein